MKKGLLYTYACDETGATLSLADGTTLDVVFEDLVPTVRAQTTGHGWKQKVVDAAAMSRDPATGRSASEADKLAAMRAVHERLLAGQWSGQGGGGRTSGIELLIRAMLEYYGPTTNREQVTAYVKGLSSREAGALMLNERLKPIIERLQVTAVAGVDSDGLLDGFVTS